MYLNPTDFPKALNDIKKTSLSHSTCKLVIFVSCLNIDALCGAKILASLFKKELIPYQLIPVVGYSELKNHYSKLDDDINNIILLGCGAMIDIETILNVDPDNFLEVYRRKIYVIDGHRPWNLDNIFGSQIIVCFDDGLIDQDLVDQKHAYESLVDLQKDDESENENENEDHIIEIKEPNNDKEEIISDNNADEKTNKKPTISKKALVMKNEQIIEDYYSQGSTIITSITIQIYSMLSLIDDDISNDIDILWLSIIGTMSLDNKYPQIYKRLYPLLRDEVIRLNPTASYSYLSSNKADQSLIKMDKDYHLFLLRHWSLYNSFFYSNYVNSKLLLWQEEGRKKLNKMFAKMGISLQVANQDWLYMDISVKKRLNQIFVKYLGLYGLDELIRDGFVRTFGYRGSIAASECVESLTSLLEHDNQIFEEYEKESNKENLNPNSRDNYINKRIMKKEKIWISNFWKSWDALENNNISKIKNGLKYAKHSQQIIFRTGMLIMDKKLLKNLRVFRLVVLKDGSDLEFFKNPLMLSRLGIWILEILSEYEFSPLLPLVIATLDVSTDTYLVMGLASIYPKGKKRDDDDIMLLDENKTMLNTFSIAFQQVSEATGAKVRIDSFENSIIEIRKDDLTPFLERLTLCGLI
ncbi:DNA replication initiation factor CDC45 [Ascoidea rubescens DSM 1968]|uniref:CDC45-like protein n=1 Tax=Ascoidea rubescens DSM 1968 TaxID=1344418 RepID=A0A1D2VQJ2_9ASCO|nr:CDC45-like protein [Ascoidea rubescens DSM 1968]ODV63837.1 CDC45-like protein [Ascoidea rubescens DSM 1968]